MNIIFRILLAIYAFCLAVFSAICMVISLKTDIFGIISENLSQYVFSDNNVGPRIWTFLIAFLFFVLSLMFLFSGVKSNKDKKSVNKHTNIGEIRISLNTIENIALNASRKINGVKETKAFIKKLDDKVAIHLKLIILSDINIPALTDDIQSRVKSSVEDTAGVIVNEVKVIVESIYTPGTKVMMEVRK